jgi:uncharacterized membrane protein
MALGVAALALGLRLLGLNRRGLWYDELLSANFAAHGPVASLLTVLRFDVHPPLYYLQLGLWTLLGRGDVWLMANSILWSVAAAVLLGLGVARRHGRAAGWWAGLLLAAAPGALAYADQVRMYPMMTALIVAVWYTQARWLDRPGWRGALVLLAAELGMIYCQTVGVVLLCGCVALGAWRVLRGGDARRVRAWIAVQVAAGLGALPVLFVDVSRNVGHIPRAGLSDMLGTWTFLSSGGCVARDYALSCGLGVGPLTTTAGLAFAALIVAIAVVSPRQRVEIGALVALPLGLIAALSLAIRPMWLDRLFLTVIPFLCLTLARFAADPSATLRSLWPARLPRWAPVAAVGVLWLGLGIAEQAQRRKTDGYTAAADWLARTARPGDAVRMADKAEFWAFMWRFDGPGWGDPLHSHTDTPSWARLTSRLPAGVQSRLRVERLCIPVRGVVAQLEGEGLTCPPIAGEVFTVRRPEATVSVAGGRIVERRYFAPLVLERWRTQGR